MCFRLNKIVVSTYHLPQPHNNSPIFFLAGSQGGSRKTDGGMGGFENAQRERTKTREQLEEEKKISLSIRIKPLEVDSLDSDQLKAKTTELWDVIVRLETEKYDLEETQNRQKYDVSFSFL